MRMTMNRGRLPASVPMMAAGALAVALFLSSAAAQCLSGSMAMRMGVKLGLTACYYDPDDNIGVYSGTGMNVGLGMGSLFFGLLGFDMTPQFRTTVYSRDEWWGRRTLFHNNIMFPLTLSLRAGMIPVVSPFIGLGLGFNIQLAGVERHEFSSGNAVETQLNDTGLLAYLVFPIGVDIKLNKWRLEPSVTFNISGSGDEFNPPQTLKRDIDISIGAYYSP
jgi:uncharacterized membrane protein